MEKLNSHIAFGKTGIMVSSVVYGTSYLGNLYTELPYSEKFQLMKKWFECTKKPVAIDSAGKYGAGLALEIIGKGLAELSIRPEDVIISNKLGWYQVPLKTKEPTFEPGAWVNLNNDAVQSFGYKEIIECYEQGNQLLGEYNAQLVSVHDPDEYLRAALDPDDRKKRLNRILESYRALFDLKSRGDIKAVGIGSKDWTIIQELNEYVKFDWVMFANSFTIFSHPAELVKYMDRLYKAEVGIINSAVFHGGFLTGGPKFDYQEVDEESEDGILLYKWRNTFFRVCQDFKIKPSDACIQFGISHPAIASLALNTSSPDKMKSNIDILKKKATSKFWEALKEQDIIDRNYIYL